MPREIKFRAWDKAKKEMFSPSSICFKGDTVWVCGAHGENKLEYEIVNENAHLMQFTGLKDKNGKDIFEGDILKSENGLLWEVRFGLCILDGNPIEAAFYSHNEKEGDSAVMEWPMDEIIGNIYESPTRRQER